MKNFFALCGALCMIVYAGTAHAAFWQVTRDTPVREAPAIDATVLDTAKQGWIVHDMTENVDPSSQWIRVVEIQHEIGSGMAYAYRIYNTAGTPVYIHVNDTVQVADQNGTPLADKKTAEPAATVQRGGVQLLPLPQMQDVACHGAVDEISLLQALTAWARACNAVLGKYASMAPDAIGKAAIHWDNETFSGGLSEVEASVSPLLERWMASTYTNNPKSELSQEDRKLLDLLEKYGLQPIMTEGSPFLMANVPFFRKHMPLGVQAKSYFAVLDQQPQVLFSDGGLRHTVRDMGLWAVQWEEYLKKAPVNSPYFQAGKERYLEFMQTVFFCDLPNTPAFPEFNKGRMTPEWRQDLKRVVQEKPNTETATLITDFLKRVQANGGKLSSATQKHISKRLHKAFLP